MAIIGLDLGGANLKAARPDGSARTRPFALWKRPCDLAGELQALLHDWPFSRLAVTMTGELCDCFADRRAGVRHILRCVANLGPSEHIGVRRTDGRFASMDESFEEPHLVASANWLALATFAGRFAPTGPAVLLDIGSTTTDVVPLLDGVPIPTARNDQLRLLHSELIYTGTRRTPVCALLEPGHGMAEFFATTHDVYLTLEQIAEDPADCDTADGRPATRELARARLARMLGADAADPSVADIQRFAASVASRQRTIIERGLRTVADRMPGTLATVVAAGAGEFLARTVVSQFHRNIRLVSLSEQIGAEASSAACAVAVATLFAERCPGVPKP